ncbi:MAG: class II aldolase/adducin family protein [Deltaproteobacteria bacterium]|nr:class II aldolase/adducin family protein [Deltaproteobacteria bacterium]
MAVISVREFLEFSRMVQEKGLVSGSGGNVSYRMDDGRVMITPTGRSFEMLREDDIVIMDMEGRSSHTLKPSKEYLLHTYCYAVRPEVRCVVHVHSVYAVALSCLKHLDYKCAAPAYTPGYGARVGELEVLPYMEPGSPELAAGVRNVIAHRNSVLLANHGLITVGENCEKALNLVEEIEENAQLYFLLKHDGRPLSEARSV